MAFTPVYNFTRDRSMELVLPEEGSQSHRAGCAVRLYLRGNYFSMTPDSVRDLIRQLSEAIDEKPPAIRSGQRSAFG